MSRQQQKNKKSRATDYLLISLFLATLLLNSCGLFRGSYRVKTEEKVTDVVTEVKADKASSEVSSGETEVNKDVNTKVTETVTKTTTSGTKTKVEVKREDLKDGKAEMLDSFGRKVILSLDSLKESLIIEIEAPTVTQEVTSRTIEQTDKSKESNKQASEKNNIEAVATRTEDKSTSSQSDAKETRGSFWNIIGMWLGVGLFIVIIGLVIKKFIFKR